MLKKILKVTAFLFMSMLIALANSVAYCGGVQSSNGGNSQGGTQSSTRGSSRGGTQSTTRGGFRGGGGGGGFNGGGASGSF